MSLFKKAIASVKRVARTTAIVGSPAIGLVRRKKATHKRFMPPEVVSAQHKYFRTKGR